MMPPLNIPHRVSERANVGEYVQEIEALEWANRFKDDGADPHWTLGEAAAYEAEALAELLARWRGER